MTDHTGWRNTGYPDPGKGSRFRLLPEQMKKTLIFMLLLAFLSAQATDFVVLGDSHPGASDIQANLDLDIEKHGPGCGIHCGYDIFHDIRLAPPAASSVATAASGPVLASATDTVKGLHHGPPVPPPLA